MSTDKDYAAAAEWAEHEMTLAPAGTDLRGEAAARFGRETLERALGGRPSIDSNATPGQHSRVRQVRLAADTDAELDALAQAQQRTPSAVLREALDEYLRTHQPPAA